MLNFVECEKLHSQTFWKPSDFVSVIIFGVFKVSSVTGFERDSWNESIMKEIWDIDKFSIPYWNEELIVPWVH